MPCGAAPAILSQPAKMSLFGKFWEEKSLQISVSTQSASQPICQYYSRVLEIRDWINR
jgi:hypothetical protein